MSAPTVTITASSVADGGSTKTGQQTLTFTTSGDTTDFLVTDITVTNGAKTSFSGSGSSYTVIITPTDAGEVVVTVDADAFTVDSDGNEAASFTYEFVLPEAVITSPDVERGAESHAATRNFRIDYDVAPIAAPSFTVTNGTAASVTAVNNSTTAWTFTVTPSSGTYGDVVIDLATAAKKRGQLDETFSFVHVIETYPMNKEMASFANSRYSVELVDAVGDSATYLVPVVAGICGHINWATHAFRGTIETTTAPVEAIKLGRAVWIELVTSDTGAAKSYDSGTKVVTAFRMKNTRTGDSANYDVQIIANRA